MLRRDVQTIVERELMGVNPLHGSDFPPILDRIMAFRGIEEERPTSADEDDIDGAFELSWRQSSPPYICHSRTKSPSPGCDDLPDKAEENPLERFHRHFDDLDGVPRTKPQTGLVSWFLSARCRYAP